VAATHLSQLGQDLEIYASREFGLVQLADSHSRASALMPQKRNPYALAVIRTQAGQAAGDLAAALATLHTGSARTDHFHLLNGLVPRALEEAVAVARLAAAVADGLELDLERMARVAREGFVASADVADVLALEGGLDYRSAHKVVGRAVRDLDEAGAPPIAMTPDVLAEAAQEVLGHPVDLPAESLAAALDPAVDIRHRPQPGSCSPEAMAAMLATAEEALSEGGKWSAAARARSAAAEQALLGRAREIAAV
jgi:argininosuccinate lyase